MYDAYFARRQQLPGMPAIHNGPRRGPQRPGSPANGNCSSEKDDEDVSYLWAQDHDHNASTPMRCAGDNPQREAHYDAFGYDAVFAIAHALHDLIEVQNRTEIVGSELLETLIKRVRFEGVTGLIDFHDASADPDRLYHGDRRVGT